MSSGAAASRNGRLLAWLAPLALAVSGCSVGFAPAAQPDNGAFSITPATAAVDTNCSACERAAGDSQPAQPFAARMAGGSPAAVRWSVSGGDPSAGAGSIDASGRYTPPAYLTADHASVVVKATLESDPESYVTSVVTIRPGFLEPIAPQNAALTPGGRAQLIAYLTEVGGGSVDWALSSPGDGALSDARCESASDRYTRCTVTYSAPPRLVEDRMIEVTARVAGAAATPVRVLLNNSGISTTALTHQAAQAGSVMLGSSGGNDSDYDYDPGSGRRVDCCGGTLGALLEDAANPQRQYILSNNHVLAMSDQASAGDAIDQPGLIDEGCSSGRAIGTLRYALPLASPGTNADAALALSNGAVDAGGGILGLGLPGAGPEGSLGAGAPAAGAGESLAALAQSGNMVVKSGRTTGLTCSAVDAVALDVEVDYYSDCAETSRTLRKRFRNQISVAGSEFADAGDSGSLLLDAANAQPVALFFAGGDGESIATPINDVLGELSDAAGTPLRFVGGGPRSLTCLSPGRNTTPPQPAALSPQGQAAAQRAAGSGAAAQLTRTPGVLGIAPGASMDAPGEPALLVYIEKSGDHGAPTIPIAINGIRTQVVATDASSVANGTAPHTPSAQAGVHLPEAALAAATAVKDRYADRLLADPAVFGVGVTQSFDNPSEAAVIVFTERGRTPRFAPATLDGLRVRYVALNRLHVTKSKLAGAVHPSRCALKTMMDTKRPLTAAH